MRTTAIQIQPFDVQSPYLKRAAHVYVQTWKRGEDWALGFFSRQACAPGFVGYVALVDGDVVGMGFGSHSLPGQWWHDKVAARVGAGHPALQAAWVLVELAVLDSWRGMGIGGILHDRLLQAQPCPRTLLSTQVDNARARHMYEQRGWLYLHPGFAFEPGNPPYLVMHKEL
jgi:GNAT superfamily N-acetyltransferase